jgi:hypothetical protein
VTDEVVEEGSSENRSDEFAPLSDRDRGFLRDYLQFGYLHHVVAAEALRSAYERAGDTAAAVRAQVERIDRQTAETMAADLNDGARVQTVVVARLLSEFVAACEDLGALLLAIRKRSRRGVMVEYLEATVSGASDMFDLVIDRGGSELPTLLALPNLEALKGSLDPGALEALEHDYGNLGDHLVTIGRQYRDPGGLGVATDVSEVPEDRVAVVLGVTDPGEAGSERRGGVLAQAHNKIKHRFAVIEDIELLGLAAGGTMKFGHYPRDQRGVLLFVNNITQVALAGAELAALLITLDDHARGGSAQ